MFIAGKIQGIKTTYKEGQLNMDANTHPKRRIKRKKRNGKKHAIYNTIKL